MNARIRIQNTRERVRLTNKKFCILYAVFCILLAGCQSNDLGKTTVFAANVMTIDYRIIIGKKLDTAEQEKIQGVIDAVFQEVNTIYNKWNPESELSKLNRIQAQISVKISPQLESILTLTDKIVRLTEGRFDPTINPLQNLWKKYLEKGETPPDEELQQLISAVGWDKIHFAGGVFIKDHDLTSLDLGGIAKGLCVDLLVEGLNQAGYPDVFVEWGGEIRTSGEHPERRPWRISIVGIHDSLPEHSIAFVDLNDGALATSGDYLQNWTVQGKDGPVTYFHIINPKTYKPLLMLPGSIASASVQAETCAFADGLATAAMTFRSSTEAQAWLERMQQQFPLLFWIASR